MARPRTEIERALRYVAAHLDRPMNVAEVARAARSPAAGCRPTPAPTGPRGTVATLAVGALPFRDVCRRDLPRTPDG